MGKLLRSDFNHNQQRKRRTGARGKYAPANRTSLYPYFLEHFADLKFQEIEEAFFFLLLKSYRYKHNLEHSKTELLTFEHADKPED